MANQNVHRFVQAVAIADWKVVHLKNGDVEDMSVDGSSTVVNYDYTVPDGKVLHLHTMSYLIVDGAIEAAGFGGLVALTNGCLLQILQPDDTVDIDFTADLPYKRHAGIGLFAGAEHVLDTVGAGDDSLTLHQIMDATGAGISVPQNCTIRFVVRDDLTGLTEFFALVQGLLLEA